MTIIFTESPQGELNLGAVGPAGGVLNTPGQLNVGGHLVLGAQNAAPTATAGYFWGGPTGSALLPGTVTGNDNTGRVFFQTGATATRGDFLLIFFATPFTAVPNINVSAVSPTLAAALPYVTPSFACFGVGTAGPLPASASLNFFYSIQGITAG